MTDFNHLAQAYDNAIDNAIKGKNHVSATAAHETGLAAVHEVGRREGHRAAQGAKSFPFQAKVEDPAYQTLYLDFVRGGAGNLTPSPLRSSEPMAVFRSEYVPDVESVMFRMSTEEWIAKGRPTQITVRIGGETV